MATPRKKIGIGTLALGTAVTGGLITGFGGVGGASAAPVLPQGTSRPATSSTSITSTASSPGAAFAMTNATKKNEIVRYARAANGTLKRVGSTLTRGLGIGVDLDTQGPLRLSADHEHLYAVNAGSDDVSVFKVDGTRLKFQQKVYAGDQPVSLTVNGNRLYVLDGSVASNSIRGFTRAGNGKLTPITNSVQPLSSPVAVPGDIEFSPDGSTILVTEKTTALTLNPTIAIDAFAVDSNGVASPAKRNASVGVRPFSLAFRNDNQVLVGESFDASAGRSAVSSYHLRKRTLSVHSASVRNTQTDTCWIVITDDGRYAFTANFGSGTISSYKISGNGSITLQQANAANLGPASQPVDLAQTADSHYLYQLLRGTGAVASFGVGSTGALTPLGITRGGLPIADGASGLAVY